MLLEMALLVLIGVAIFLYVLTPLIRPTHSEPEPDEDPDLSQVDGQHVGDTL